MTGYRGVFVFQEDFKTVLVSKRHSFLKCAQPFRSKGCLRRHLLCLAWWRLLTRLLGAEMKKHERRTNKRLKESIEREENIKINEQGIDGITSGGRNS